jgi:predicted alpha/beta superfamily hydrolase
MADVAASRRGTLTKYCSDMKPSVIVTALLLSLSSAIPAQRTSAGVSPLVIGETFTLESTALGERRRINVYLPVGYADSLSARFPVLYMLDGGLAEDFLHIAGLVQICVADGTMRPFILVGIENTERRRDLTGPTQVDADKGIAPRVGGSAAFRSFIGHELKPQIRKQYRTTAESAIIGESLAGLFVVETFLMEPDLFDTYIAVDPSLWWNDHHLVSDAGMLLHPAAFKGKAIYLASGSDAGIDDLMKDLTSNLARNTRGGLRWFYEAMPGETHRTVFHPAALRAMRKVLAPPTANEPRR